MFLLDHLIQHNRYVSFAGIAFILAVAFICSSNRKEIKWRFVRNGLIAEAFLAFFVLKTSLGHVIFQKLADMFTGLYLFAGAGAGFVFASL